MAINSQLSDETEIWTCFKDSNEDALRLLMKRFYGPMYNYGFKFSRNEAFIKDCIQDVFIGLWQYRDSISIPKNTRAYLLTAVRRKMFSNRQTGIYSSLEEDLELDFFSMELSPELVLIEEESMQAQVKIVSELLNQLSERQREVIYLKFYQGLSREEIATIMGISDQSVSNLFQKAIHSLRKAQPTNISFLIHLLVFTFAKS